MFSYFADGKQITKTAGRASVSGLVIVGVVITVRKSTDGLYFMFNKIPHFKLMFLELYLLAESFINTVKSVCEYFRPILGKLVKQ